VDTTSEASQHVTSNQSVELTAARRRFTFNDD
jgi:hypothetical protein